MTRPLPNVFQDRFDPNVAPVKNMVCRHKMTRFGCHCLVIEDSPSGSRVRCIRT